MKILYRYIDTNGNPIEDHVGELGNWSYIPADAIAVQVIERRDGQLAGDIQPCPDEPCEHCTGNSAVVKGRGGDGKPVYMESWEWCQEVNACAATIDWEKVAGR